MYLYSIMKWSIYICLWIGIHLIQCQNLGIVSRTRTTFLEKYVGYVDAVIIHLQVPKDSTFASFKFLADETQGSVFSCNPRKISLYMKHGALPVINPDGSIFPKEFKNISRSELYNIEMESDKKVHYLNITSPRPGPYYISTFLSYTDPAEETLTPEGLISECYAQVEVALYASKLSTPEEIIDDYLYTIEDVFSPKTFKFYIPEEVEHALLFVNVLNLPILTTILVEIETDRIPSNTSNIVSKLIETPNIYSIPFSTKQNTWYFLNFDLEPPDGTILIKFQLKYFFNVNDTVDSDIYGDAITKIYQSSNITKVVPYKQYNLLRDSTSASFAFTFDVRKAFDSSTSVPINVTNNEFVALEFQLRDNIDIGGSISLSIAFKPRVSKNSRVFEREPDTHQIIGCIRADVPEFPVWPNLCEFNGMQRRAPLILNKSVENDTIQVPFPEAGSWFATFKLFCDKCVPCDCPNNCQIDFEKCNMKCEETCIDPEVCNNCAVDCKRKIIQQTGCSRCDCDGPCVRSSTGCNSSLLFDISAYPCTGGRCSKNGRCVFSVSDGLVYTSCICLRNYRGWDCSDDSQANPYWMVVLELLLLVLSNLMFLPAVYVAYKRKYYIEAITYFSICFFSTFYHACDAGENIISMCITKLNALQFADFFCALLAIWVTLIAIADLPLFLPNLCHVLGAIILAFIVTINKTSVWVFAVPAISGVIIVGISWFIKYKKVKQAFIRRYYLTRNLPIGVIVVVSALIIFGLLQTKRNYKYLHSLWHVLMAIAVIIMLPRQDTFQPETIL